MLTIVLSSDRPGFTERFKYQVRGPVIYTANDMGLVPFRDWALNITTTLALVRAPYVMLADSDDLPANLDRCVDFLEANPDYVCASGRLQGFYLWPDLVNGPHSATTPQYAPFDTPTTYDQDSAAERVLAGFQNSWSYFAVYRTPALLDIWQGLCALNITDLQVHEKWCAMKALSLGKVHCDPTFTSYYRQHGTSIGAASNADWIKNFTRGAIYADMHKVLSVMEAEGVDRESLYIAWMEWYRERAFHYYGPKAQLRKIAKAWLPGLAWYVQNRHRYLPHQQLSL